MNEVVDGKQGGRKAQPVAPSSTPHKGVQALGGPAAGVGFATRADLQAAGSGARVWGAGGARAPGAAAPGSKGGHAGCAGS
jgi:hypothetical protein